MLARSQTIAACVCVCVCVDMCVRACLCVRVCEVKLWLLKSCLFCKFVEYIYGVIGYYRVAVCACTG